MGLRAKSVGRKIRGRREAEERLEETIEDPGKKITCECKWLSMQSMQSNGKFAHSSGALLVK